MPFKREHQFWPWDEASQCGDVEYDPGVRQIAVAGPPGTACEIVRVHAGVGRKTVTFASTRTGARPTLPSPEPVSSNEVLLGLHVKPYVPALFEDGPPQCRVEGSFTHALVKPLTHKDNIAMGTAGYDKGDPGNSYTVTPADWVTDGTPTAISSPVGGKTDYTVAGPQTNFTITIAPAGSTVPPPKKSAFEVALGNR